jgi:hypothetical protein
MSDSQPGDSARVPVSSPGGLPKRVCRKLFVLVGLCPPVWADETPPHQARQGFHRWGPMLMQKVAVVNSTEEPVTLKEGLSIMSFGKVTYKRIADDKLVDAAKDCRFTF